MFAWIADCPVPPFDTPSIPEMSEVSETSEVPIEPAVAFKIPERDPTEREPKNPEVDEAYVKEAREVDEFWNVCAPVNVLVVYVLGIVVEELIYEFTPALKFDTCEFVIERLLSVVIEFTEVVAARFAMKLVLPRAVVK